MAVTPQALPNSIPVPKAEPLPSSAPSSTFQTPGIGIEIDIILISDMFIQESLAEFSVELQFNTMFFSDFSSFILTFLNLVLFYSESTKPFGYQRTNRLSLQHV